MSGSRLEQLLQFLADVPDDSFTLYSIAYEYMIAGDPEKAHAYFQQLLESDPDYTGAYYHLGQVQEQLGQSPAAEVTYRKGIEVASRKGDFHAKAELLRVLNQLLGLDEEF